MAPDFFRSANLVYRRIPPSPSSSSSSSSTSASSVDDDPLSPLFTTLTWDPSRINASPAIWDPPDGPSIAQQMRGWATAGMLLSVYICLPCSADAPGALPDPASLPPSSSSKTATPAQGPAQTQPAPATQYVIPLGIIHLSSARTPAEVFGHLRKSRLGIVMAAEHQGKGYGGEALRWITDWGFRFAGLHRIELSCGSWNRGAARLYERTGYVREGVRRRSEWCLGKWRDEWDFAMLEDEFWSLGWVESKGVRREGREGEDALVELLGCW